MIKYSYTFPDGATGELALIGPNIASQNSTILILPGMGIRYTYYIKFAKSLALIGYEVFLTDYRGVGTSSVRASRSIDFHFDQYVDDGLYIIETVDSYRQSSELIILGHSMGGQLGCLLAARSKQISGLILIASCLIYYKGFPYPERFSFRLAAYIFPLITKVIGYFPGDRLGFGGKVPKGIIRDWAHNILTGEYASNSNFQYNQEVSALSLPIFILSFEGDRYSSEKAIDNLTNKISNQTHITTTRIKEDREGMKHDHYSWARHPQGIVPYVDEWLNNTIITLQK